MRYCQFRSEMILITACTSRKIAADRRISPTKVARGTLGQVSERWAALVESSPKSVPAGSLYEGAGPEFAQDIAEQGARWYVVSAGVSLVSSNDLVPQYDCTVTGRSRANVLLRIVGGEQSGAADWWGSLTATFGKTKPLRRLIVDSAPDTVCLALPAGYLGMVRPELEGLSSATLERLRVFVADAAKVPSSLQGVVMPYGVSLGGSASPYTGANSTLCVRAAHHFVTNVFARSPNGSAAEHARLVRGAMQSWPQREVRCGESRTDIEIRALIRWLLRNGFRTATAQLRFLRSEMDVACEQHRFHGLFSEVTHG